MISVYKYTCLHEKISKEIEEDTWLHKLTKSKNFYLVIVKSIYLRGL